jgi:hypothetical protein
VAKSHFATSRLQASPLRLEILKTATKIKNRGLDKHLIQLSGLLASEDAEANRAHVSIRVNQAFTNL